MKTTHIIAIDPAFRKNGFGVIVLDVAAKTVTVQKIKDFSAFLEWSLDTQSDYSSFRSPLWVAENSNLQQIYYASKYGRNLTKAMNVGKNLGLSQCVCDYLNWQDCRLVQVSPKAKGKAFSMEIAQLDAKASGWVLPKLNGDELAAYKLLSLVYGRRDKFQGGEVLK